MSMAMGPGFDPEPEPGRDEHQRLQARVFDLEKRVARLERILNAMLGVPQSDLILDVPPI